MLRRPIATAQRDTDLSEEHVGMDLKTRDDAIGALAMAIVSLMEDAIDLAATAKKPRGKDGLHNRTNAFQRLGADITQLGAAMEVVARRAEPEE